MCAIEPETNPPLTFLQISIQRVPPNYCLSGLRRIHMESLLCMRTYMKVSVVLINPKVKSISPSGSAA